jgi:hypothetical protein
MNEPAKKGDALKLCKDRSIIGTAARLPSTRQSDQLISVSCKYIFSHTDIDTKTHAKMEDKSYYCASCKMRSAAFSPIMMAGRLVLPDVRSGITLASTTRSLDTPRTCNLPFTTAI